MDAESLQEAKLKLIRNKIAVLRVSSLKEKEIYVSLSKSEVLNLTREISRLLQAGLPLFETLSALAEKYVKQKPHRMLLDLCERVRSGESFSEALAHHKKTFDLLYIAMIANAEKTGQLAICLNELAHLLSKQIKMGKQLVSALLYPAILSVFCLVVLSSLLFFVIPSLRELFDGHNLHPFTRIVFAASQFACHAKGGLVLLFIAIAGFISAAILIPKVKEKCLSLVVGLPYLKNFFAKVALIRFCRAVSTLLEGGVSLLPSLNQARFVMRHPVLEKLISQAEMKISQGDAIYTTFQNHPLIPPLIPRMLGIAEQGGKLPFMMQQIAEIYEDELEKALESFATVVQPILLLILGAIIGFVLLSVLLPLTDVSSFAT